VSESKFRQNPAAFIPFIQKGDTAALTGLITKPEVEERLLIRLRKKAMLYAQDFASDGEPLSSCANKGKGKINVDCVVDLYENYIIPLTKEVEVRRTRVVVMMPHPDYGSRLIICYRGWMACRRRT
jgi:chorismate mutase